MYPDVWKELITNGGAPPWPCPRCKNGVLSLLKDSLVNHETVDSNQHETKFGFDFDAVEFAFSCWLQCGNCGEHVAVVGCGGIERDWGLPDAPYYNYYRAKFAWPMPDVFHIPKACPKSVADEVRASFRLMWIDRGAAASRLRTSVEHLLTHFKVPSVRRVTRPGRPGGESASRSTTVSCFTSCGTLLTPTT